MGKTDLRWSTRDCLDQTKFLDVTLDPTLDSAKNNGQPPPAILISRILQSIERRCPNVDITLCFAHCKCDSTPVSVLGHESFPRVRKLVVYVGNHDPEETHQRRLTRCGPNQKFWSPFVDGMSFPHCKNLEVRHHWAKSPPEGTSLDLCQYYSATPFDSQHSTLRYRSESHFLPHRARYASSSSSQTNSGSVDGLEKFESIVLEATPELSPSVLMQFLGDQRSTAANLSNLELRFCDLGTNVLAELLYHVPANLERLVLLCRERSERDYWGPERPTHLCPLLRQVGKKLMYLEYGATDICRELFFDEAEIESLIRNGVKTKIGQEGGANAPGEHVDVYAVKEMVQYCRKTKRAAHRERRFANSMSEAQAQYVSASAAESLFGGGPKLGVTASRVHREVESALDEEEEQRKRLVEGSKTRWCRRFIAWQGLCSHGDTWEEMQVAADMEEDGITWVLASRSRINGY